MPSSAKPAPGTPAGPLLEDFMRKKYEKLEWVPRNRTAPGELVAQGKSAGGSASSSEERTRTRQPRRDSRRRSRRESRKRASRQDSRRRRKSSSRSDSRPLRSRKVQSDRGQIDEQFGDFAFAAPSSEANGFASFPSPSFSGADFEPVSTMGARNAHTPAVEDKAAILSSNLSALYNGSNQSMQHQGFHGYSDVAGYGASAAQYFGSQSLPGANCQSNAASMAGMVGMVARGYEQPGASWQPGLGWGAAGGPGASGDPSQPSSLSSGVHQPQGGFQLPVGFQVSQGGGFQQAGGAFQHAGGGFQHTVGHSQTHGGVQQVQGFQPPHGGFQQIGHFQQSQQPGGFQCVSDQYFQSGSGTAGFPGPQWGNTGGAGMHQSSALPEAQVSAPGSVQQSSMQRRDVGPGDILTFTGL